MSFLIDVDGVCLDWLTPFMKYMRKPMPHVAEHDLSVLFPGVDILNKIACFAHTIDFHHIDLSPGVIEGVHALREKFPNRLRIAVSSCGTDDITQKARRYQLRHLPLDAIICLPLDASKRQVFAQFKPGSVIEDHIGHARAARELGHQSFLLDRTYNRGYGTFERVKDWQEIVERLT